MNAAHFQRRYGPWAVIAGASSGLGEAFAEAAAAQGLNIVLVARRGDLLAQVAARIAARYGIHTRMVMLDLAQPGAAEDLAAGLAEVEVGLLVFNAARSLIGPFLGHALADHQQEVALNCQTPLALSHLFGARMVERGRGGIVLLSSLSATMGSPLLANYAATKAYNLVLAEGLWEELRGQGVDVMACVAGATSTPNYLASKPRGRQSTMTPNAVARGALAALGSSPSFIPGRGNRLSAFALRRLFPRSAAIRLMGRVTRGMYGEYGGRAT